MIQITSRHVPYQDIPRQLVFYSSNFQHYYDTTSFLLSSHRFGRGKGVNTGRDDVEAYRLRGLGMLEVLVRVHCARTRIR